MFVLGLDTMSLRFTSGAVWTLRSYLNELHVAELDRWLDSESSLALGTPEVLSWETDLESPAMEFSPKAFAYALALLGLAHADVYLELEEGGRSPSEPIHRSVTLDPHRNRSHYAAPYDTEPFYTLGVTAADNYGMDEQIMRQKIWKIDFVFNEETVLVSRWSRHKK